uniref:Uncharacterized protein n=1 Tax=Anguilla anguilla TaxID=7936 RepID=A0A0E9Y020_ANGAN
MFNFCFYSCKIHTEPCWLQADSEVMDRFYLSM